MAMVTVTINGLTASGREGMTILELTREMGIPIPTLCHHAKLMPAGACRVCLVEEERSGSLLASCVSPLSAGMVIRTDSPRVLEARRMVIKLMLASHPESCLLCDKGNRCELRRIAAELGIGLLDLYKMPHYEGTQEVNPFIKRDLSKCILCGRCIRADQELVVEGAIDYFQRGFDAKPSTLQDQPLEKSECTFCGTCVTLCPTGALSEKNPSLPSTVTRKLSSVCPYCACGCAILLGVNGGRVVQVSPEERKKSTVNSPALCVKGHYGWDFIYSPERLKVPLIRREGRLVESSWEEALDFTARELMRIRTQEGPDALAFLGSSQGTNEELYLFQKLARGACGTNNIDHGSPLTCLPYPDFFGPSLAWGAMTAPVSSIEESKAILVIGANPEETAPIVSYRIKRAVRFQGAKLFLVDPRRTKLALFAHSWLRPQLGKDWALILGAIGVILEEGLFDKGWVERHVEGLEGFRREARSIDLAGAERESGIEKEALRNFSRDFASSKPGAIIFGSGLWQGSQGLLTLQALINLALLVGSANRFYPLGKESNGQGARDMGALPSFLPGYPSFREEGGRKKFEEAWGRPLPQKKGLGALQMIAEAHRGKVRGMYILGENPLRSFPDRSFVRDSLEKLEFLAVQDLFLTETAQLARVVLPGCSFAEKEGTLTNGERRIQWLTAAEPPSSGLPEWKILTEISRRAGLSVSYSSAREILEEINSLVSIYGGVAPERLEKGNLHWPCMDQNDPGSPELKETGSGEGKAKFFSLPPPPTSLPQERMKDVFQLLLGSTLYHFGSGTRSTRSKRLSGFDHRGALRMNPEDAAELGLQEGCRVRIRAGKKEMTSLLSLDRALPRGVLFLPISGHPEGEVCDLLTMPVGPVEGFPLPKTVDVQLERI